MKAKQETPFWRNSEGTHTRWKKNCCFARLVKLIFMVFWHQSTLGKIINQVANSVNSDLPVFSSVQATSLWRVLHHRRTKSLSRKLKNEGAKDLSATSWRFHRDLLQNGRLKQTLLRNDIVTSIWRIATDLIYAYN